MNFENNLIPDIKYRSKYSTIRPKGEFDLSIGSRFPIEDSDGTEHGTGVVIGIADFQRPNVPLSGIPGHKDYSSIEAFDEAMKGYYGELHDEYTIYVFDYHPIVTNEGND